MVHLATPAGKVLLTGDYSVSPQQTVPALARPNVVSGIIVSEATYGERLHEDRSAAERRLVTRIAEVVDGGGRVLSPAFAVGRAQEVLCILRRAMARGQLARIPVWVDGMVRSACDFQFVSNDAGATSRLGAPSGSRLSCSSNANTWTVLPRPIRRPGIRRCRARRSRA
jgi:Cft2 family RNA processing exonuclease